MADEDCFLAFEEVQTGDYGCLPSFEDDMETEAPPPVAKRSATNEEASHIFINQY